jgi:hypothetical protein
MEKQSLNEKFTNALQGKRLEKTSEHKLTNRSKARLYAQIHPAEFFNME